MPNKTSWLLPLGLAVVFAAILIYDSATGSEFKLYIAGMVVAMLALTIEKWRKRAKHGDSSQSQS